jgi:hypothetical protein
MAFALIVSPIRSWPLDQGNRARVLTMGRMLKERGYTVHFLLSGLEGGPNAEEWQVMRDQWDLVEFVPYQYERRQRYGEAWGGDDWYDPALDTVIRRLSRTWSYDLCLLNYAWYSKAFDSLPSDVVRVVDTHDAFGDRHKRLYEAGTTPAWYFTRPEEEGRCLDRADYVISIQEEEQAWFEGLTSTPVHTVGHVTRPNFLAPRRPGGKLRAGYMASGNPSNQDSIRALLQCWAQSPFLASQVELHVAGPICEALSTVAQPYLIKHGFVPDPMGFYQSVDIAVNPNIGGSGLKIKSVEALSYGLPLYATAEGMLGICDAEPPYVAASVAEMARCMAEDLAAHPDLEAARRWSRNTYLTYRRKQIGAFEALLEDATGLHAARRQPPVVERS